VILDFQLQEHEKFLSHFTKLFKEVDDNNDGILTEDQFRELVIRMHVINHDHSDEEIESLLKIIDPHNIKTMTYSQIVRLLSNQLTN
jgi:Ca2+-binding EF-hand superfamily protein